MDVLEIRSEDSAFIGFSETQNETVLGIGPGYLGAEEVVVDGLVRIEAKNDVVRLLTRDEVGEVGVFERGQGV